MTSFLIVSVFPSFVPILSTLVAMGQQLSTQSQTSYFCFISGQFRNNSSMINISFKNSDKFR